MAKIRTFISIDIGKDSRVAAEGLQKTLGRAAPNTKWVAPAHLHVTLAFLGDVNDRALADVFATMAKVARTESPFLLSLAGVGAFPTVRRPKTVWAGVQDGAEELGRLHAALEDPLLDLGLFRREDRGYTPHLTLGRVSDEADETALSTLLPTLKDWVGYESQVTELVAYASELRKDGPEYSVLGRVPLGKRKST